MNRDDPSASGFIERWSRRKGKDHRDAVAAADATPRPDVPATATAPVTAVPTTAGVPSATGSVVDVAETNAVADAPVAAESVTAEGEASAEPPLLGDDDMVPLTTLDAASDLSPFFNRGVSAALRRAALRHVFSLPAYNVRDGLNDYDHDYTRFEPLGDTITADMKFHAARHERNRLRALAEEGDGADPDALPEDTAEARPAADGEALDAQADAQADADDEALDADADAEVDAQAQAQTDAETETEDEVDAQAEAQTDAETDAETETEAGAGAGAGADADGDGDGEGEGEGDGALGAAADASAATSVGDSRVPAPGARQDRT